MNRRIANKVYKNRDRMNYSVDQLRRALIKLRYGHIARTMVLGAPHEKKA